MAAAAQLLPPSVGGCGIRSVGLSLSFTSRLPLRQRRRLCFWRCTSAPRGAASAAGSTCISEGEREFLVVSFYKFVFIENPAAEVARHFEFLKGLDIHGRIYINEQGINAQYSGRRNDTLDYANWLKDDSRFQDILVQASPAPNGHAFPRLRLRYKPSLVQMEGGTQHLPVLDPSMRATPLAPSKWRERVQPTKIIGQPRKADESASCRKFILLDVRNGYEWDIGHFIDAERPNVDRFRSTYFGLPEREVKSSDPLAGVDRDNTDILMYCTGGIRCDIYSTILRKQGFQNLYTLSGGVSNYLASEGPSAWVGNLFVFDSRLSLPPSALMLRENPEGIPQPDPRCSSLGRCYICFSQQVNFRHRNCANLDCNRLFLCCNSCVQKHRGCCCVDCTVAPRLRPALVDQERYQKWHVYRDNGIRTTEIST